MAHTTAHSYDSSVDEALREIRAERTRKAWIAAILFALSGAGIVASFYFSYR